MKLTKAWIPIAAALTMLVSTSGLAELNEGVPATLEDLTIKDQAITPESIQRVDKPSWGLQTLKKSAELGRYYSKPASRQCLRIASMVRASPSSFRR